MSKDEATDWLTGKRSMCNTVQDYPNETWQCRIVEADAAMMQQAYWVLLAYRDGLIKEEKQE